MQLLRAHRAAHPAALCAAEQLPHRLIRGLHHAALCVSRNQPARQRPQGHRRLRQQRSRLHKDIDGNIHHPPAPGRLCSLPDKRPSLGRHADHALWRKHQPVPQCELLLQVRQRKPGPKCRNPLDQLRGLPIAIHHPGRPIDPRGDHVGLDVVHIEQRAAHDPHASLCVVHDPALRALLAHGIHSDHLRYQLLHPGRPAQDHCDARHNRCRRHSYQRIVDHIPGQRPDGRRNRVPAAVVQRWRQLLCPGKPVHVAQSDHHHCRAAECCLLQGREQCEPVRRDRKPLPERVARDTHGNRVRQQRPDQVPLVQLCGRRNGHRRSCRVHLLDHRALSRAGDRQRSDQRQHCCNGCRGQQRRAFRRCARHSHLCACAIGHFCDPERRPRDRRHHHHAPGLRVPAESWCLAACKCGVHIHLQQHPDIDQGHGGFHDHGDMSDPGECACEPGHLCGLVFAHAPAPERGHLWHIHLLCLVAPESALHLPRAHLVDLRVRAHHRPGELGARRHALQEQRRRRGETCSWLQLCRCRMCVESGICHRHRGQL
eukprot:comp9626_c0_seq1/m.11163 comp9626_c0_seq1/g.11163  ORF comp9626_c0_seq1/g.11163 comp9626_c0_seq1/m.11163 type:complete len:542 (-) comp9626_c0_seq1:1667-3292(-)